MDGSHKQRRKSKRVQFVNLKSVLCQTLFSLLPSNSTFVIKYSFAKPSEAWG